jgi:Ala-tRNA(Pro) deacylase
MNNEQAHSAIRRLFDEQGVTYRLIAHEPTRTSEDSARVRALAGAPNARGAKALIVKCEFRDGSQAYSTLVMPSQYRADTRTVRTSIPGLKKFRFLSADEMEQVVNLSPGCMPPFGPGIFDKVQRLYIDPRLQEYSEVGFNAARLETSLIVACSDYLKVAKPTAMVPLTNGELVVVGGCNES